MDVEVVEIDSFLVGADHDEPDPLIVHHDMAGLFGNEGFHESGSGAFWGEASEPFEAFAHRGDAKRSLKSSLQPISTYLDSTILRRTEFGTLRPFGKHRQTFQSMHFLTMRIKKCTIYQSV